MQMLTMTVERIVIEHYRHGALEEALLKGLAAAGKDPDKITADDLAPADEFHSGGRQATVDFAAAFGPKSGMHLLDIGSGLGGPSRYFAVHHGCRVTGIDLSDEFVAVAASLSRRVGVADRVDYRQASATQLPFADHSFDGAYMLHVGMNISDKAKLFSEVHRVLKPGGTFGIYDAMRVKDGPFTYPVPWASGDEANFIATPATYRALLTAAGFEVVKQRDRSQFVLEYSRTRLPKMRGGPPPLGIHIVQGPATSQKLGNMLALLESGTIAPVELICRRGEVNSHAGNV